MLWKSTILIHNSKVISTIELSVTIWWTKIGLGKHVYVVPSTDLAKGLRCLFIGYFFFFISVSLAKLSCLLYYVRIFTLNSQIFRTGIWICAVLSSAWMICCVIVAIWECKPIEKAWNPTVPGHCINTFKWWIGNSVSNVVIDLLVLLLPMPMIWKLKMGKGRIALLIGVFTAGYWYI
jgi:hypothetical protein